LDGWDEAEQKMAGGRLGLDFRWFMVLINIDDVRNKIALRPMFMLHMLKWEETLSGWSSAC